MGALKGFLMGALALATPGNIATVKAIVSGLAAIGSIRKDDGAGITAAELEQLWDAASQNFTTLGDEARASQARVTADIAAGARG